MTIDHGSRIFWREAAIAGAADATFLRTHLDVLVDAARTARYRGSAALPGHVVAVAAAVALAAGRRPLPDRTDTGLDLAQLIADQDSLSGEHMHALLTRFRDDSLRRTLAGNRCAPATVLSRLLRLSDHLAGLIAVHPNTSSSLARRLWSETSPGMMTLTDRSPLLQAWDNAPATARRRLDTLADRSLTSPQAAGLLWPVVARVGSLELQFAVASRVDELTGFYREQVVSRCVTAMSPSTDAATARALLRCWVEPSLMFRDAATDLPGVSCLDAADATGLLEQLCAPDHDASAKPPRYHRALDRTGLIGELLDGQPQALHRALPLATGPSLEPFLSRLPVQDLAALAQDRDRPTPDRMAAVRSLAAKVAHDQGLARVVRDALVEHPGELMPPSELDCWEAVAQVLGPETVLDAPARLVQMFRTPECQRAVWEAMAACGQTALFVELAADFPGSIADVLATLSAVSSSPTPPAGVPPSRALTERPPPGPSRR